SFLRNDVEMLARLEIDAHAEEQQLASARDSERRERPRIQRRESDERSAFVAARDQMEFRAPRRVVPPPPRVPLRPQEEGVLIVSVEQIIPLASQLVERSCPVENTCREASACTRCTGNVRCGGDPLGGVE